MKAFLLVISSIWSACDWGCFVHDVLFLLTFCSLEFKHFPFCFQLLRLQLGKQLERNKEDG